MGGPKKGQKTIHLDRGMESNSRSVGDGSPGGEVLGFLAGSFTLSARRPLSSSSCAACRAVSSSWACSWRSAGNGGPLDPRPEFWGATVQASNCGGALQLQSPLREPGTYLTGPKTAQVQR